MHLARRARIALLPFWALFWAKNPFCNRDILNIPFLLQKIYLFALFWGIMALLYKKISILFTFTMIFYWKFSSRLAILWIFRRYAPIWFQPSHRSGSSMNFYLMSAIRIERSTFSRGMGMCIVNLNGFSFNFGPVKHILYWEFRLFSSEYCPVLELMTPFFRSLQSPFALFRWTQKSVPTLTW